MSTETTVERVRREVTELVAELPSDKFDLVECSKDLRAIVDPSLADPLRKFRWYSVETGEHIYPVTDFHGRSVSMQRIVLLFLSTNRSLEHINNVGFKNKCSFDCRETNLVNRVGRTAIMRNRRKKRGSSSMYKGVRKKPLQNGGFSFSVGIMGARGRVHLGTYDDEVLAAKVYDAAAFLLFKGAAFHNFPDDCPNLTAMELAVARLRRHGISSSGSGN